MRRTLLVIALSALALPGPVASQAAGPDADPACTAREVRELRLGVVCYGGISLAIYMFGTTRELHHLLLASDALDHDACASSPVRPGEIGPKGAALPLSARPYYRLLAGKWKRDGVRTRVVVDIISGTSAGGINGIVLAKAIATNGRLDPLRELWFEEADFARLAGGRPWTLKAGWRLLHNRPALLGDRWLLQLYRALSKMEGEPQKDAPSSSLLPPGAQLDLLVMSTDFYGSPRVVEVGDPATSFDKYHNQVFRFVAAPGRPQGLSDFAGANANATLAFAGRSSASFPVAFPATSIKGLIEVLAAQPEVHLDGEELARRVFGHQLQDRGKCTPEKDCSKALANSLFLVDGGVLDNYPLGIAFERAGRTQPAPVPAQRIFLYLEPDPAEPPPEGAASQAAPKALQMLLGGKATIPGNEPIFEDFRQLAQHNERVDRILDLLARNEEQARLEPSLLERQAAASKAQESAPRPQASAAAPPPQEAPAAAPSPPEETTVAAQVEGVVDYDLGRGMPQDLRPPLSGNPPAPLSPAALSYQRRLIEQDAAGGQAYLVEEAYLRLRVRSVLDQLARNFALTICRLPAEYEGPRASLARAIVFRWAEASCLKEASSGSASEAGALASACPGGQLDGERRSDFLSGWDVGYLRRNLRFVLAWIDGQAWTQGRPATDGGTTAGSPDVSYGLTPDQLQRAHAAVAGGIEDTTRLVRGEDLPELFANDPAGLAEFQELRGRLSDALCVDPEKSTLVGDQAAALIRFHKLLIDRFVELLGPKLAARQDEIRGKLFQQFVAQTGSWSKDARRAVLARYLGFPYWDRVSYPYTAFSGTGELVRASVVRLSPRDARSLSDKGAARLSGSELAHFGAFRHRGGRERREHDYLWGRLDGAERLSKLLGGPAVLDGLFSAILEEEAKAQVPLSERVLSGLRSCVQQRHSAICDRPFTGE